MANPIITGLSHNPRVQRLSNNFQKDFDKTMSKIMIATICLKDGIGCGMYVYQSATNENIPPKRRMFVTTLDLVNGALMIGAQILMFKTMNKYSGKLTKKLFKGLYDDKLAQKSKSFMRLDQKINDKEIKRKTALERDRNKELKDIVTLVRTVIDLVATTIIAKRILVPLVATPLAGKLKDCLEKREQKNAKVAAQKKLDINTKDYENKNVTKK